MFTSNIHVRMTSSYYRSQINLQGSHAGRHVIQATMSEGLAQGPTWRDGVRTYDLADARHQTYHQAHR